MMATQSTIPKYAPLSDSCMDAWVTLFRSLRGKTLLELRTCSVAKMGELLIYHVFGTRLFRMKTALEDFFSWVNLLTDWHEEMHLSQIRHLTDLHSILSQTNHLRARDHERLEAFSRDLAESEHLMRLFREAPLSYVVSCVAASRRHLQESIAHTLQERQCLMTNEIHHLEEPIDQERHLRDSQWGLEFALSSELEYLERIISLLDYHVLYLIFFLQAMVVGNQ
ncbi:hypothetical protein LIER_42468 [Lithospermum erythrorhizon]|uniref:Uncharacterized protein n=1 Tax=Lithospermum erythrorhizon TaxID=34254 RepID=A0AAV3RTC0_LITER